MVDRFTSLQHVISLSRFSLTLQSPLQSTSTIAPLTKTLPQTMEEPSTLNPVKSLLKFKFQMFNSTTTKLNTVLTASLTTH